MYEQIVSSRDAGQRMDKYLHKLLPEAGTSFIYKMLRKKNITLNDRKAQGAEKLVQGDSVKLYFSQETLEKFMGTAGALKTQGDCAAPEEISAAEEFAPMQDCGISVIYENEHLLFVNKPAGILSQKAKAEDYSVNDWLLDYLRREADLSESQIRTFRPCVCNRLDRNTSGLVLCAKTLRGAQFLSDVLKYRRAQKYYLALVKGRVEENMHLGGFLRKDERTNKVTVTAEHVGGGVPIETSYEVLRAQEAHSLLKVHLITGKPHQIRAHLASIGHPIIGDGKYGDRDINRLYRKKYGVKTQMLHAWQVSFAEDNGELGIEAGRIYSAAIPELFDRL